MASQRWNVGAATITSVVEDETHHIPPELFFPDATAALVAEHPGLVPDYADEHGNVALRVQALVVDVGPRRVLVDPCVGNGKARSLPFWNDRDFPFMERFAEAGLTTDSIDTVVHTHLHADHVGWDTTLVDGAWTPTFPNARHLYTARELEFCRANAFDPEVFGDSVEPIFAAGLADVVAEDTDLGDGMRLVPSPGHTPGHLSLWLESDGERALITGDFLHHPIQFARPDLREVGDEDVEQARATRRRMMAEAAQSRALVIGTHFSVRPAGRVVGDGDVWRWASVN